MKTFFSVSLLAAGSAAHTIFQELYVDGVSAGHEQGIRVVQANNPITDVSSNDIICNTNDNYYVTPYPPTKVIEVAAGSEVTTEWHHSITGAVAGDSDDPIASSHLGPIISYLAKVDDATTTTTTGLKWFKIFEDGLDSNGTWGVTRMINNKGKVNFTIPSCVPAGQYLMRHELIALHGASTYPGAQFYLECAQLKITGSGAATPATVSFPGAYNGSDPGITFNLYYPTPTSYAVPGPTVFECPA